MPTDDATVDEFLAITGVTREEALPLLDSAGGDLATAVELFFAQQDSGAQNAQDAAVAAQVAADEYGYGEDDDGEEDFPEEDEDGPAAHGMPPPRLARSPVPGGDPGGAGAPGGGPVAPAYPRLGALYAWMARNVPLFGYAEKIGSFAYRVGIVGFLGSLLWAPLALLGLVGGGGDGGFRAPPGPVRPFSEWFEENHGTVHPRFFRGSCQTALSRSKSEAKFLLAYLHDHGASECDEFCSKILASALFVAFCDENFILWVGELHTAEGRAVRRALRVQQQPAIVMLAHGDLAAAAGFGGGRGAPGDPAAVQALGTVQGARALNEEGLIASLHAQLQNFEPLLIAARAEQHERMNDRLLREEQEAEYNRALAEDEAREEAAEAQRAAAAAAEAEAEAAARAEEQAAEAEAQAAAARQQSRAARAAALPPEPPMGPDVSRLVIRLPDGRRLDRRFEKTDTLQLAIDLVAGADPDGEEVDLVSNFPRKVFTRDMRGETLESLGLHPAATLFTREIEEDE